MTDCGDGESAIADCFFPPMCSSGHCVIERSRWRFICYDNGVTRVSWIAPIHIITNFIITIISGNVARKRASPGSEIAWAFTLSVLQVT